MNPRTVKFPAKPMPLSEVLKELEVKTGNLIIDARSNKTNPDVTLRADTFWKVLDALGKQESIGFSPYHEGGVALIDRPYRVLKVHHSGLFRFAFKRVALQRDDEARTHTCQLALDVAWEPRLKLIYLNLEQAEVGYRKLGKPTLFKEEVPRQVNYTVAGANASTLEFQFNAPDRATRSLDIVKGTIKAVGAPKMLEFQFAKLEPGQELVDEMVKVALPAINKLATRWTVDLTTIYPKGAILPLESFQEADWMLNNRVWLSWTDANKKERVLEPTGWAPRFAKEGTRLQHLFEPRPDTPLPPPNAAVRLHVRTPNRVVAFTVPFELQDLPLP